MALPSPRLDDRGFQDLVDDAKRLVQRRCPEWTDHNLADPGVTLIETFAFMTDQLLYRLNRVPDRLYVKFLDLIGLRMLPPTPARVPVTFWMSAPPDVPFAVPSGTRVSTFRSENEDPLVFTTARDLEIVPCALSGISTWAAGDRDAVDRTQEWEFGTEVAAFCAPPECGDAVLLALSAAVPGCAVRLDFTGRSEGVGVNPRRPPLVWEAATEAGWVDCELQEDATGGLNRSGALVLHVPEAHTLTVLDGQATGWLRARVVEPDEGQPAYSASPVIAGMTATTIGGTVLAVHAEIVELEVLGASQGVAGQRFVLGRSPVLAGLERPVVEVGGANGWQVWECVGDFAESASDDRHVVLDHAAGEIVFGPVVRQPDGSLRHHGTVPEHEAPVRIRRYTVGGGPAGNVGAGAIRSLRTTIPFVTAVENRHAATGGVAGETLEEAKARGPLLLRTRSRAVTVEDYEILAREAAPEVARVRCVPANGVDVPSGTVKILVVPAAPIARGRVRLEDLIPAEPTLQRIARRLEETRVADTRVHLEPPRYRGVTVVSRLVARTSADPRRITDEALEMLYKLLCPLPGGGPDGTGWPFGRPVQTGELYAVLQRVPGVDMVEEVRLFGADPVSGKRGGEASRLELDAHSLVFSFEHQVRVEER